MVITARETKLKAGYKQTEVGVIPEEWTIRPLGDLVIKVGSGITPTGGEKIYKKEGRPFLRSQNVGWGYLLLDDIAFIDEETHASFSSTEIKPNDVLLNITGASIGRSAIADNRVTKGNVNQHVCIIRTNSTELDPRYLNFLLLSESGQKQIDSFQAGGNRQGLNFGQIRSFQIPCPSLHEQQAIATALSDIDALLASLDKLIAKKRGTKQATMQQLLSGKIRLPAFSERWKLKSLGEIGKPYGGLSGKSKEDFIDGQCPYIPFLNILNNPVVDAKYFDYVNIAPGESQNKVAKGDLFFNGSSETPEEVGMCSMLNEGIPNLYLNSFCFGFRVNKEAKANALYLAYYFRSSIGRQLFFSLAQGATRYNLSKSNFLKVEIPYPEPEEQAAIATVLSDMDAEIAALEQRREKTRALKQGMMQELLTGRIRLL